MSENKFIARLKGEPTPKSVVEIQNDRLVAPFKSSPMGHIADRDSSVVVAKGAQNWAVNQGQLVPVADDYIGTESDLSGTSRVSGAGLWLNATYTFPATGDETNPVSAIIAPSAKWVLTLCGDSLITQNGSVITLTMLVKIGATHLTTKQFKVRECASQFSQRLAIDFSESEQSVIKAHGGSPLTVQVLCDDEGASATIYSGMTHLTLLQRKIDADLVATDNVLLPEFIDNLLEGYIIPADYFSNYEYLQQVEDGGKAMPEFTRNGDNMTFTGWFDGGSIKNDLDDLGDQVSGIEEKIPDSASATNQLTTKEYVDNAILALPRFRTQVVDSLPSVGEERVLYLVKKTGTDVDSYDEYIWVPDVAKFEFIGTTQVDLTGYATTGYVNTVEQEIRADMNEKDSQLESIINEHAESITTIKTDLGDLGEQVANIESKIPDGTSDTNPLINKQQLLDEEMDIREDLNSGLSELQTQITAQAAEIAAKQDQLIAGENITIVDNVISATGGGGAGGITNVVHDTTLTGSGTTESPLGLAETIKDEIASKAPTATVDALTTIVNDILTTYLKKTGDTMTGALNVPEFTVSTAEGSLSISVVAGVPVIASNNGMDIASRVKFDYTPTTDDNTTYANALEVSLMRKAQVAAAISDAMANVDALPDQTSNAGKVLTTDGSEASWTDMPGLIIRRL